MGCIPSFAAFPSTIMEAAFGRLHKSGAGAFGARPTLVESIMVDGKAANLGIQPIQIGISQLTPNPKAIFVIQIQSLGWGWG